MFLESDGFRALADQVMMIRRTRTFSVRSVVLLLNGRLLW